MASPELKNLAGNWPIRGESGVRSFTRCGFGGLSAWVTASCWGFRPVESNFSQYVCAGSTTPDAPSTHAPRRMRVLSPTVYAAHSMRCRRALRCEHTPLALTCHTHAHTHAPPRMHYAPCTHTPHMGTCTPRMRPCTPRPSPHYTGRGRGYGYGTRDCRYPTHRPPIWAWLVVGIHRLYLTSALPIGE